MVDVSPAGHTPRGPNVQGQSFSAQVLDVRLVPSTSAKARPGASKGFRPTATGRDYFLHIERTKRYFLREHCIDPVLNSTSTLGIAGWAARYRQGIEEVSHLSQLSGDLSGNAPRHHVELRARPEKGTANAKGVPIGKGSGAVVSS